MAQNEDPAAADALAMARLSRRNVLVAGAAGAAGVGLSALLAACGVQASPKPAASAALGGTRGSKDERYVMVSNVSAHPFWLDMQAGGKDAAEQLGVTWEYTGPEKFDDAAQVTAIEQIIGTKPAGLIIPALTADAVTGAINTAIDAGIPVVCVDSDAPKSKRPTFVGTDNFGFGQTMGTKIVELLGGTGDIGVSTVPGQSNLEQRLAGINSVIGGTGVKIVATTSNEADDSKTATTVTSMLQANPSIKLIACLNATGAGVATALKETNNVGKVQAIVADSTKPIIQAVQDGTIQATLVQRVYLEAYLAVNLLFLARHPSPYFSKWVDSKLQILPARIDTGVIAVGKDQAAVFAS